MWWENPGPGKSQLFLAVMGLLAANGRAEGSARLLGDELIGLSPRALDAIRGRAHVDDIPGPDDLAQSLI